MGVCASSEAKPEKDLNSDGLAKEHFNKEVLGENSDSSTHGYIVFSDFIFSTALFLTLNANTPDQAGLLLKSVNFQVRFLTEGKGMAERRLQGWTHEINEKCP